MSQIRGCDTSHWNGAVNFKNLKVQGYEFVFAKATEGALVTDDQFARSRVEAPKAGLLFGAYHFFHPAQDVEWQVKHFEAIGSRKPGELPPVLDWETTDKGLQSKAVQKARALQFCQEVERIAGIAPMLYGSPGFFAQFGDMSEFSKYPLFLAQYASAPQVPHAWKAYTIWQYSGSGGLDKDLFNGTLDQLKALSV